VLDRASPVPLYYQLAQNMETAIRSGRLSSGSHLDNDRCGSAASTMT
jgi:DNA-binding transcriptional regulator YhcF (GntR family)